MRLEIAETSQEFARRAADIVCAAVRAKPDPAIGLASGNTPLGLYAELRRRARAGDADFSHVAAFAVDELYGVPRSHPAANASYFLRELTFKLRSLLVPNAWAPDAEAECARFRRLIELEGGLDLVVLGIGKNGHIAFNEPGSPFDSRARKVALAPASRETYAQYFGALETTPACGLTLGIADLLEARAVLLLAAGDDKAAVVSQAIEGPVSEAVPASALQRHPDVIAVLDRPAAARLRQAAS